MSLTKLSKVEESIALYLSAAEKFNELVHHKQPVSSQITRGGVLRDDGVLRVQFALQSDVLTGNHASQFLQRLPKMSPARFK
jgi:hypothetical protein